MAEYSGFFDGPQEYTQTELARYFDNIYETGIAMIDENTISYNFSVLDGKIKVETGFAIIKGFYHYLDEAKLMEIISTDKGGIFIGLNLTTNSVSMYIKYGSTTYPTPQKDSKIYELQICSFTKASSGNISLNDNRLASSRCTILRTKNLSDFNSFMASCKEQWNKAEWKNIYVQAEAPTMDLIKEALWLELI